MYVHRVPRSINIQLQEADGIMPNTHAQAEEVTGSTEVQVTLEAARLERAVRSARIAEAMNFREAPEEVLPEPQPMPGMSKGRMIAATLGALSLPAFLIPIFIGPIGLVAPGALVLACLVGCAVTSSRHTEITRQDYIGP